MALPALATGYGPLTLADFLDALRQVLADGAATRALDELRVILRHEDEAEAARMALVPWVTTA